MPTRLTSDEYVELRLMPRAGADPAFREAAELERDEMLSMSTGVASNHLCSRGYDSRQESLELLIENGAVRLEAADSLIVADVETAADYFDEAGLLAPFAAMCDVLGSAYADFLRSLRETANRESQECGQRIPADDQYFVAHRVPAWRATDNAGNLVRIDPAVISLTLCDDAREPLERRDRLRADSTDKPAVP